MNSEILYIITINVCTLLCAIPLGKYMGKIFNGEKTKLDNLFRPIENFIFKICSISPNYQMNWKQHLGALLSINLLWLIISTVVLMNMSWLPLNPDHIPSMSWDLAFHTSVSFITNTNLQHYSGETGLSYLGQMMLMLWQFISAATGMAICAAVFIAMKEKSSKTMGNFYTLFVKSSVSVLFPVALLIAIFLVIGGVPMTFNGKISHQTLEGIMQHVSTGPIAAFEAIKQVGTNGGGFFGANAAHPLENPNAFTNAVENISIIIFPIAMVFALGKMLKKPKLSRMIYSVMTIGFLAALIPTVLQESHGNPQIHRLGIHQSMGNMEGKENRFGSVASANWAIATTVTSNGSVNAMHDSLLPISGMFTLLNMMINCFYGGIGVGFLNFYIFMILAVFISGLMIGRTPELFGKKITSKEMQIAMVIALLHPLLILTGTAIAVYLGQNNPQLLTQWLKNPGYHGFSEILYEFTSASANNGSGFEGLGDNHLFWNISTGLTMLLARYIPIAGPVAIAGLLAEKKFIPEGKGTLQTDQPIFAVMIMAIILIIAALAFFPALALGPIAEHLTIFH